ncbi:MAG TPA: glutamate--tRNA ligase [Candidatus Norongarragalinales archaeon]|jgi:glutamyl-tRNA synthetase|nr:glutamate--tRNA ligase [Candidatus Norongarragalinales archaeon]
MSIKETALKFALKNAHEYGQAEPKSVISKLLAEAPEAKKDMRANLEIVKEVCAHVNGLSKPQLEKEMSKFTYVEKEGKHGHEWTLDGAIKGHVITRFAPEPSAFPHIGHAKALFLVEKVSQTYGRKVSMLRFDDTNPENEEQEFVEAFTRDAKWLGVEFEEKEPRFASDHVLAYYKYADQLIKQNDAYSCTCEQEEISADREAMRPCVHRNKSTKEVAEDFERMKKGLVREGLMTLRLKGDMKSLNTTLRDPVIFRVIDKPHYRQGGKYKAWPVYDFETPIEDSLTGVTHVLRSKEYELRDELYKILLNKLKLRVPVIYDFSRLEIKGTLLSKRLLKPLIAEKLVWGWDDPRLPTIAGVRRRGILPQALREFVQSFGLSKVESEPGWDKLLSFNRKLLEPVSEHYYVTPSPKRLIVKNAKPEKLNLPKLANDPSKGPRVLNLEKEFFIAQTDFDALKDGEVFRLKGAYNVKISKKSHDFIEGENVGTDLIKGRIVQFVPAKDAVECTIVKLGDLVNEKGEFNANSLQEEKAVAESSVTGLKEGQIIQAERVGYLKLDSHTRKRFILAS